MVRLVRQKKFPLEIRGAKNGTFLDVLRNVDIVQTDGVESPSICRFRESWAGDYMVVVACPISLHPACFERIRSRSFASTNNSGDVYSARIPFI
jgi:hypothetical protein